MSPERRSRVEEIVEAALLIDGPERGSYLHRVCADDADLRREVESLLVQEKRAGTFLTTPALEAAARAWVTGQAGTPPAAGVGPYRVDSLLGAGAMGEVYRAWDTRLERAVALKFLPREYLTDASAMERFRREARAASALNHSNICTVYDIGNQDGRPFIAMEFLDGQTLRARLSGAALPARKALAYAIQIAHGLAAAHRKGIVHRDLKPENLWITRDEVIKILDFGLAKVAEPSIRSETAADSLTTEPGTLMGTVGYMSPEQVRGERVDHRTDIFSFGVILHEMLAGKRTFSGASAADTISAILNQEPGDLADAAINRVVRRCLEKDREKRFQSVSDLAFALETPADANPVSEQPRRTGKRLPLIGVALTLSAAALVGILWPGRTRTQREPVTFRFGPPENTALVAATGVPSPDGRQIAFLATDANGQTAIWVRSLASSSARRIPGTEDATGAFWSPDGKFVGFETHGKLRKVALGGGPAQNICNISSNLGASWSPSGDIILAPYNRTVIHRVPASGGTPRPITTLNLDRQENSHRWPYVLPDGRHFLFTARSALKENTAIYVGSLDSSQVWRLTTEQSSSAYAPPGYLLFARNGTLMAQRFDARKLELTGDAFPVADAIQHLTANANAQFSVSAD